MFDRHGDYVARPGMGEIANAAGRATWTFCAALQQRLAQPVDILWSTSAAARRAFLGPTGGHPDRSADRPRPEAGPDHARRADGIGLADDCRSPRLGSAVGPVVICGRRRPPRLRTIAAAFDRRFDNCQRRRAKVLQLEGVCLGRPFDPADLLAQLGRLGDVEIIGIERVPHDLWAAADLPPLSLVDRLTLIAVQFDLTFKVAAGGAR